MGQSQNIKCVTFVCKDTNTIKTINDLYFTRNYIDSNQFIQTEYNLITIENNIFKKAGIYIDTFKILNTTNWQYLYNNNWKILFSKELFFQKLSTKYYPDKEDTSLYNLYIPIQILIEDRFSNLCFGDSLYLYKVEYYSNGSDYDGDYIIRFDFKKGIVYYEFGSLENYIMSEYKEYSSTCDQYILCPTFK